MKESRHARTMYVISNLLFYDDEQNKHHSEEGRNVHVSLVSRCAIVLPAERGGVIRSETKKMKILLSKQRRNVNSVERSSRCFFASIVFLDFFAAPK